ncbi:MAG: hypothetical protein ACJA1X_002188, partial [Bermanella sp.]
TIFLLFTVSISTLALDSLPNSYEKLSSTREVNDHWVILGAIERITGAVQPEADVRLSGKLTNWLWKIPGGHDVQNSFGFVKDQMSDSVVTLFECEGRNCGLSNDFANQVFSESILNGRNSEQKYWVGFDPNKNTLWLAYGSERSNQRVYLYAEKLVLTVQQASQLSDLVNSGEMKAFLDKGYQIIKPLGELPARLSSLEIDKLKRVLKDYPTQKFALVVHRYSDIENQRLVNQTQKEAQSILEQIAEQGGFMQHLYAHGAGAMFPRDGQGGRIELVELKLR